MLKADIWIYDSDGVPIGGMSGYTAKRATRAALLSSVDALDDLMYEVIWRDRPYAAEGDAADTPGAWILSPDRGGVADRIAAELAARNQTVVIASATPTDGPGPTGALVDPYQRESWRSVVEALPDDVPLRGVVHLAALDGHGAGATTDEMRQDVTHASGSALALVQGLVDADAEPEHGVWFVSRGGQVLDHEHTGALAGAMLWGFGKVVTRELARLPARVIDLDPDGDGLPDGFIDELLAPDGETLVAYRAGDRRAPRLVRGANGTPQLPLPEDADWRITRDPDGDLRVEPAGRRPLAAGEVRVAVEAAGVDEGVRVLCGRVIEAAPDVAEPATGDGVVGFSDDAIGPTVVVRADLTVPAPAGVRAPDLAATPITLILDELDAEATSSLADYIEDDPARVRAALGSVVARLATGELHAPPVRQWPLAQAAAAADFAMSDPGGEVAVLTASPIATGRLREDRTYLVTGGLGGIGGAVAGWLAERGAGVIVLNGRRPPDEAAEDVIRSLRERGATVQVEIADVADARALRDMLARIDEQLPPLGGVIHSVGALSDAALINQSWERFEEIVWPKVLGAWELHRATEHLDLDLFILFSSMSGVRGNPGQANYSSANAFLDQLARHRRALGLPGQAVQWGAWLGVGEAEQHRERIESTLAASGAEWMTPQQGVRALDRLVRQDLAVGAVTSMDWSTFAAGLRSVPPLIEELLTAASDDFDEADALAGDLVARVREAPEGERYGILVTFVQDLLQTLLRLPSRPAANVAFFELGIDSLMALELRARLNDALGGAYTASNTIAFDYPNAEDLGAHLVEALRAAGDETPAQPVAAPEPLAPPRTAVAEDAVAIVGMACRFPGAEDVAAFWRLAGRGRQRRQRAAQRLRRMVGPAGRRSRGRTPLPPGGVRRRYRPVRRVVLPRLAGRGPQHGPAAPSAPRDELARARGRGRGPGPAARQPRRPLRGHRRQRVPGHDGRAREPHQLPRRQRTAGHRARGVCARDRRAGPAVRRRLRVRACGSAPRGERAPPRRGGHRARRWRQRSPLAARNARHGGLRDALRRRGMPDVRRLSGWSRPRRGVRRGAPQAPGRCTGGRRPYLGGGPWISRQPEQLRRLADRAQRAGAAPRHRGRPVGREARSGGRRLPRGSRSGLGARRRDRARGGRGRLRPGPGTG